MSPSNLNLKCGKRLRTASSNQISNNDKESYLPFLPSQVKRFVTQSPSSQEDIRTSNLALASNTLSPPTSPFISIAHEFENESSSSQPSEKKNPEKTNNKVNNLNNEVVSSYPNPSSPPSMPRLRDSSRMSLLPKAPIHSFRSSQNNSKVDSKKLMKTASLSSPFAPVQSPSSKTSRQGNHDQSPCQEDNGSSSIMEEELLLSVPNVSTSRLTSTSNSLTSEKALASPSASSARVSEGTAPMVSSFIPKKPHHTMSLDLSFLPPRSSHSASLGTPPRPSSSSSATSFRLKQPQAPSTCQRRKKPCGYQQAGRDDFEEVENNTTTNNNSRSRTPSRHNYLSTPKSQNIFSDFTLSSPGMEGRRHHQASSNHHMSTPNNHNQHTSSKFTVHMPQNRYPFSPNPFSPHYSPIPQQSQYSSNLQSLSFSPTQSSPSIPSLISTPKKQSYKSGRSRSNSLHEPPITTPHRKSRTRRNSFHLDPTLFLSNTQNATWGAQEDTHSVASMSVSQDIVAAATSTAATASASLAAAKRSQEDMHQASQARGNSTQAQEDTKDEHDADDEDEVFSLSRPSHLCFTGSPIQERGGSTNDNDKKNQQDKSFDSSLASPTPSEDGTVAGSVMSFDMNPDYDNNITDNNQQIKNLSNPYQSQSQYKSGSSYNHNHRRGEGISPTDILSFPPPSTPCKGRPSIRLTQRRHVRSGSSSSYSNYIHMPPQSPSRSQSQSYANSYAPLPPLPPPITPKRTRQEMIFDDNDDNDYNYNFLHSNLQDSEPNNYNHNLGPPSLNSSYVLSPSSMSSPNSTSATYPQHQHQHQSQQPISRFASDFEEVGQLGTGSFGTVYKCMSRLDGCMYAIKTAKRKAKGNADRDRMLKEVYALAALCDQADTGTFHIVRYHQAWMEEERLFIQTELCGSTLQEEIQSGILIRCVPRRYKLLREICLALELIHRNDMVHLDIKPDNIFIKGDQYKLGDFGLVTKATTEEDVEEGDSRYMSLELLSGDHKDLTKSDIFSLGATLYEVCIGRPLPANGDEWHKIRANDLEFDNAKTAMEQISYSPRPATTALNLSNHSTPQDLREIIHDMMNPNFTSRPPAHDLLQRRPLLSEEQKKLIAEQNKVREAYQSLAKQRKMLSRLSPPKQRKRLVRASTWDAMSSSSHY